MKIHTFILIFACTLLSGCSKKSNKPIASNEQVLALERKVTALEQQNAAQASELNKLKLAALNAPADDADPEKAKMQQITTLQKDLLLKNTKVISAQKTEILRLRKLAGLGGGAPAGGAQAVKTLTRTEFVFGFMGKPSTALTAWSRPSSIFRLGGTESWSYDNMTIDPTTGDVDQSVGVGFKGGKVTSIVFTSPSGGMTHFPKLPPNSILRK